MERSPDAQALRNAFYQGHCRSQNGLRYGTKKAFWQTFLMPFSTAFQVGGFANASAINNGNGTVTFTIPNTAGAHSFFYHIIPNSPFRSGPFSNIYQTFHWTEKIQGCGCGK